MRKYLLPENGTFYKANLHCHSTVSDGLLTPEEIKEGYLAHGYSVVAYTDHDIMIDHSDLADERFLPMRGFEVEINGGPHGAEFCFRKTAHVCFVALDPSVERQVCWHRSKYLFANAENYRSQAKFDETLPDYERQYTPECISDMMQKGRAAGFFVTYNHPRWSKETRDQYIHYNGMHAMEICNYSCWEAGYEDYCPSVYDEMLQDGKRIFCTANDDNHNVLGEGDPDKYGHDSFGGFNMIKAERLDYTSIGEALRKGHFYASMGPEIYDLYVENDRVYMTTSPAARITMNTGVRSVKRVWASNGELLTEASFPLRDHLGYFRLTVMDEHGRCANTQAYFMDELKA